MKKITNENEDYRLGSTRQEYRFGRSQSNQPKPQQDISRNKVDSVKAEMRNRSRENFVQGKTDSSKAERKNEGRTENS